MSIGSWVGNYAGAIDDGHNSMTNAEDCVVEKSDAEGKMGIRSINRRILYRHVVVYSVGIGT